MTPEERNLIVESLNYTARDRRERASRTHNADVEHMLITLAEQGEAIAERIKSNEL